MLKSERQLSSMIGSMDDIVLGAVSKNQEMLVTVANTAL